MVSPSRRTRARSSNDQSDNVTTSFRERAIAWWAKCLNRWKVSSLASARAGDPLAAFALGEMRLMDLPRLPQQSVALAGMCCVDAHFRRRGLFRELEQRTFLATPLDLRPRLLSCGRLAHPASF